ncbi:type III secretion system export apparatus subunit SctS [Robbsia sp. Bb-Pol-6]|uniref:Type III secretion system export apparatus subunit SctS n=1 Tax=Robbsia betulipollinis TaxID=2981849 RepID=A0ABT3ZL87_9BURK|nr:type III secretion system export apparatus subunit SctS [Robbsia betulipollinis]MCY0387222.1 type III secretion system export apparatus subunit SctS [Robbsia betulipollinis]
MDEIIYASNKALVLVLLVSAPAIVVATVVGIAMGLFQTVTQLQEQTLPFGVKLIAVLTCLLLLEHWMATVVMDFAREVFRLAFLPGGS